MDPRRWLLLAAALAVPLLECCGSSADPPIGNPGCDAGCEDAPVSDAGGDSNAPTIDSAVQLVTYRYVVDRNNLPTTNAQAREYGLDLDGDQTVDNQFGQVIASLGAQGIDTAGVADKAVDRGDVLTLVETNLSSTTSGTGNFTLFAGATPSPQPCTNDADATCRKHLSGGATFTIAASSARDTPLSGVIVDGGFTGGPGKLHMSVPLFGGEAPIALELVGARVSLSMIATDTLGHGIIAGGLRESELHEKVIPEIRRSQEALVARDCTNLTAPPGCGCASQSAGRTALDLFDTTPKDCKISLAEIEESSLFKSLLAPDLTIDGTPALSFGMKITAVRAVFTP